MVKLALLFIVLSWSLPARALERAGEPLAPALENEAVHGGPRRERWLAGSAYPLERGELRLGIWRADYALTSRVSIGTLLPLWLLSSVSEAAAQNVFARITWVNNKHWALATAGGLIAAQVQARDLVDEVSEGAAMLYVVPLQLTVSLSHSARVSSSWSVEYTFLGGNIRAATSEAMAEGVLLSSHWGFAPRLAYFITENWALEPALRFTVFTEAGGVKSQVILDSATSASIDASVTNNTIRDAGQVLLSAAYVARHISVRAGVGYGNYFVPHTGVMLPDKSVIPEFDVSVNF